MMAKIEQFNAILQKGFEARTLSKGVHNPGEKYENALLSNEITRLEERRRDHCINLVSDLSEAKSTNFTTCSQQGSVR